MEIAGIHGVLQAEAAEARAVFLAYKTAYNAGT